MSKERRRKVEQSVQHTKSNIDGTTRYQDRLFVKVMKIDHYNNLTRQLGKMELE
jgi:hypothetical protein